MWIHQKEDYYLNIPIMCPNNCLLIVSFFSFFHFSTDVSAPLLVSTCKDFFLSNCCSCSSPWNIKESPDFPLAPQAVALSIPLSPQMVQPSCPLWLKNHLNPFPLPFTATITSFQRHKWDFASACSWSISWNSIFKYSQSYIVPYGIMQQATTLAIEMKFSTGKTH